jgi:hypothetical protein
MTWAKWIFAYLFDCVHRHTTWLRQQNKRSDYLLHLGIEGMENSLADQDELLAADTYFCLGIHAFHARTNEWQSLLKRGRDHYLKSSHRTPQFLGLLDLSICSALLERGNRRQSQGEVRLFAAAHRLAGFIRLAGKSPVPYSLTMDAFGSAVRRLKVRESVLYAEANCFVRLKCNPVATKLVTDAIDEIRDHRTASVAALPFAARAALPVVLETLRRSRSASSGSSYWEPLSVNGGLSRKIIGRFLSRIPSDVVRTYPVEALSTVRKLLSLLRKTSLN